MEPYTENVDPTEFSDAKDPRNRITQAGYLKMRRQNDEREHPF